MKKLSFYFLATVIVASLAACGSDNDCSMVGQWKVKSADVTSEKLDSTILGLAKEMMMKTTYSFTADSVTIVSGGQSGTYNGSYAFDPIGMSLTWNTIGTANASAYNDNMKIVSCSGTEVSFLKRNPADTTQAALTLVTVTLERAN